MSRSAKRLGDDVLHLLPHQLIAPVSELLPPPGRSAARSARPAFTTTIASGAASSRPRYRPSIWARCLSASLRTLMSRMAAVTRIPSALSSGLSMISIGNSAAVLAPPDELDSGTDLLCQRLGCASRAVGDEPFREAFGNDVLHFLPDQFIAAVSKLLLRLNIQQDDLPATFTTTMASGAASSRPRYRPSICARCVSAVLAHADVADGCRDQDSLGAFERAEHDLDRKLAAILAPSGELDSGSDLLCQRFGRAFAYRRRSAVPRSPPGMMFFTFCPISSSRL